VVDAINRWLTHPDPQIRSHITETFARIAAIAIAEVLATVQLSQKPIPNNNSAKSLSSSLF